MKPFLLSGTLIVLSVMLAGTAWGQAGLHLPPPPIIRPPIVMPPPVYMPPPVGSPPIVGSPPGLAAAPTLEPAPRRGDAPAQSSGFVVGLTVAAFVIGGAGLVVFFWRLRMSPGRIRVVATPPGEAPVNIRGAWVGLELPLVRGEGQPRSAITTGVVSSDTTGVWTGYVVDGSVAIKRLAADSPWAANWWREHAPHVLTPGYRLVFPTEVCERLS